MPASTLGRFRDNAPTLLLAVFLMVIAGGVALRVRYLQDEMMRRWGMTLEGGKLTTKATVDEWFNDRSADAGALASAVAAHAALRPDDDQRPYANILAPVRRRGKFVEVWILDTAGAVIPTPVSDSLRSAERIAARAAQATSRQQLSSVIRVAEHAAFVSLAVPVPMIGAPAPGMRAPAVVVVRMDVVAAFGPWAAGRPNAAQSLFATPSPEGTVLIRACPERSIPVCIEPPQSLPAGSPEALSLAGADTFGIFRSYGGITVLASTGFDSTLGWGVVRRVAHADAVVPLHREYAVEGAFLGVLLALVGMGAFAANRTLHVRRLDEQREVAERLVTERARTEHFLNGQRHVLELIAIGAPAAETTAVLLAVIEGEAPSMRCAVYELDDARNVARIVSAPGLSPELARAVHEIPVGQASQAVGTAMHRGESVHTSDIAADSLWAASLSLLQQHGVRAGWAIPLRAADGHIIGALACFYDEPRYASTREFELTGAAVHLASIALSTARDAAAVRASEASFRSFVENAPAAIFRETRDGELVSVNPAMVSLLGFPTATEVVAAARAGRLYHDPRDRVRLMLALEGSDVVRGQEVQWRRGDQSRVIVRLSARAYRDDRGDVWLWEGFAEDVTSLRAAEGALRRSERLAAVGQLISGVAHELNNPLSSILHFAEDLLQDDRTADDAEALGVIRDQARRSRSIVRDLLSFVKQRQANAESLSLTEVVGATARAMRKELVASGVELHLSDSCNGALVLADRAGLEQIVTNLVSNAAQAAGPGGKVWVHTTGKDSGCNIVVEDSGPGIPPEVLPHIFDPFFTTKPIGEGTGLGLSVTLGVVELFGGRILVDSRPGGSGSRFTVLLPRTEPGPMAMPPLDVVATSAPSDARQGARPSVERRAEVADTAGAVLPTRTALIIDDEPSIRAALRRYFGRRGWAVEEAGDGAAGLAMLERHGDDIGIVISDLRMPGFSGIELHDRLLRDRPELLKHFIFSTGDVASAEAASFVQRTQCPVLQKPFELRMLDEIIAVVHGGATAERVIA